MEFALVLVLVTGLKALWCWRAGWRFKEVVFFGTIRLYCCFWHRWSCPGGDRLPATGPVLLICNHTCSADPPLLQTSTRRVLSWLSSREHYEQHWLVRKLLDTLHCVPVRRDGRDAAAARTALQRLREGRAVVIFPEGGLSGVALKRLLHPKGGAAWLALRSNAVVIPAYIRGGPQTHHLLRSWVGRSPRPAVVRFGSPVDLTGYRGRRITRPLLEEVSALLMANIAALGPAPEERKTPMSTTVETLAHKHCKPCEGGVPALTPDAVKRLLAETPNWKLGADGKRLRREWRAKDFLAAVAFFNCVAQLAEAEGHHPDLHLTEYRNVAIEIWTHSVGGLTENDFILAAKIDKVPVEVKR